ncbi:MAG: hypothetical protein WD069_03140 [Planctomycetales bacterium]
MTIISKVLAVFVAAASLAFLGFVAITLKAGANWEGEARRVEQYRFPKTEGEKVTYTAEPLPHRKDRIDLQPVPSTSVLADAIIKAQANIQDQYKKRIDALDQQIALTEQAIQGFQAATVVDREALQRREAELVALLEAAQKQIEDLTNQGDAQSRQATAIQTTARDRREDGYRLANQLETIRAEQHRWLSQKKILVDRLVRLRQSIASLERRQARLQADPEQPAGD